MLGDFMIETRLRDLREKHDLKQKDIAEVLKIPSHTYSNYELGIRGIPLDILIDIAKFYNTSTDYILKVTDEIKAYPRA